MHFSSLLAILVGSSVASAYIYSPRLVPLFTNQQFVQKSQLLANASYYYDHAYNWLARKSYWGFNYGDVPKLLQIGDMMLEFCDALIKDAELDYESSFAATLSSEKIIRYLDYMVPEKLKRMRVGRNIHRQRRDTTDNPNTESTAAPATTTSPTTPTTEPTNVPTRPHITLAPFTPEPTVVTTPEMDTTTTDKMDAVTIVDPDVPDETGDEEIEAAGYWLSLYKREKKRHKLLDQVAKKTRKFSQEMYEMRGELRTAKRKLEEEKELKTLIQGVQDLGDKIRESLMWSLKSYNDLHYFGTMMDSGFLPYRGESRSGMRTKLIGARHNLPNLVTGSFYPVSFTQSIVFRDEDTRCTNMTDNYDTCPISYVKQHRLLTFQITRDMKGFMQFAQGERVRLDGLSVMMRGVNSSTNVTVEVMNVGEFRDYYAGDTYVFYGGPINAEAEFDPVLDRHQMAKGMKDEDNRYRPVTTPYMHWVVAVDFEKTVDKIDLTGLKALEIHFKGSANYGFVKINTE